MSKYKYYFAKPRSEITKDILKWLAISGAVCIAATSPYFSINLIKGFKNRKKYKKKKVCDTFYNLKRQGYIDIKSRNHQIYISLTKEGRKKAGKFQIDSLKINKPKKWDRKWRIVIFDIAQLKNLQRNAFRGKLKELGVSYNYFLHYAPQGEDLHFHIEICPRIADWGGFELGTDTTINSVTPEDAAEFYRE